MGKITTQLHYRKNGVVSNINIYNSTADVGSNYIVLKVASQLVYAQLAPTNEQGVSELRVRKPDGSVYGIRYKTEDPSLITSGGGASNTGVAVPAPTLTGGNYSGVGDNVACTWTVTPTWAAPAASSMTCEFTVTINPHISLSDVHHYRLKWGTDTSCATDGGTIVTTARTWKVYGAPGNRYFKVLAENSSNVVLYETPVYGAVATNWPTVANNVSSYNLDICDSAGTTRGRLYDGLNGSATHGDSARRWYFVATSYAHGYVGSAGYTWSGMGCADTCSCNCNYCACNCNYCACNCNYSTGGGC